MAEQVFTKAWSAALLNALGDVLAQLVVDKNDKLDYKRLGIFTILVLFHWFRVMSLIDWAFKILQHLHVLPLSLYKPCVHLCKVLGESLVDWRRLCFVV